MLNLTFQLPHLPFFTFVFFVSFFKYNKKSIFGFNCVRLCVVVYHAVFAIISMKRLFRLNWAKHRFVLFIQAKKWFTEWVMNECFSVCVCLLYFIIFLTNLCHVRGCLYFFRFETLANACKVRWKWSLKCHNEACLNGLREKGTNWMKRNISMESTVTKPPNWVAI